MALRRVSLQVVDDPRLGGPERDPLARGLLERDEERVAALARLLVELPGALEARLEGELADEELVVAALAPEGRVALRDHALAEVELAEVHQDLLDDRLVDEIDPVGPRTLERRQAREETCEPGERGAVRARHLAQGEHGVVGVEHAGAADPVAQRQRLGLELDLVDAGDLRPHVEGSGRLEVGVAELEDDLGLAHRKAVLERDAPPQDECVVVEAEVGRVEEDDLADLGGLMRHVRGLVADVDAIGDAAHELPELEEALRRGEAVRLEDELALEVVDLVARVPVAVGRGRARRAGGAGILRRHRCAQCTDGTGASAPAAAASGARPAISASARSDFATRSTKTSASGTRSGSLTMPQCTRPS